MSHERLAALIQAHQDALLAHPEAQATHEAMINLVQGVDTGEITVAQCARLLRSHAVLVADVPAYAALSRQAAADLRQRGSARTTPCGEQKPGIPRSFQGGSYANRRL